MFVQVGLLFRPAGAPTYRQRSSKAIQRNSALRRAADMIKGDSRFTGKTTKIEWNGERGVTVDGSFVFKQAQADLTGAFDPKYPDLTLPVR